MSNNKFDLSNWTVERYINDIPIEEYSEEERNQLFGSMIVTAVHSIGLRFENEDNIPKELERISKLSF